MYPIQQGLVIVTDRGGHLHNALCLLTQMKRTPESLISSHGPDISALSQNAALKGTQFHSLPELFSWIGKRRFWNPAKFLWQVLCAFALAFRLKPRVVVSLGASNVVPFCYCAKFLGAKIYHVDCMNQVVSASITGKLLYPIVQKLYVQWEGLEKVYGPKAQYAGWVL